MRNIHSLAHRHLVEKNPNIKMYNASLKSVLDVYPMIDYEKYVLENKTLFLKDKLEIAKKYWDKPPQFQI